MHLKNYLTDKFQSVGYACGEQNNFSAQIHLAFDDLCMNVNGMQLSGLR
jgi:hypothetical protein